METSATKKYLEVLRARYGGCSDYRIAQLLNVAKSAVSRWSHCKGTMGDEQAARLADLCGLDPVEVLTEIYIERSTNDTTRQYFQEVLKRTACALALVPVLGLMLAGMGNSLAGMV